MQKIEIPGVLWDFVTSLTRLPLFKTGKVLVRKINVRLNPFM
jgi:hypothetical protein